MTHSLSYQTSISINLTLSSPLRRKITYCKSVSDFVHLKPSHGYHLRLLRPQKCSASVVNVNSGRRIGKSVTLQGNSKPSAAETTRTLTQLCSKGTLCTLTQSRSPFGDAVEFTVDGEGTPVVYLDSSSLHFKHFLFHTECSLHVQLDQPGCRQLQCTLMGSLLKPEEKLLKQRLKSIWMERFGEEANHGNLFAITVEKVLQSEGSGQEGCWVEATEYKSASADPLGNCAAKLIKDMNDKHWEDIHRICKVYTDLSVEAREAAMIWIDKLGFDLQLITESPKEVLEVRIPFPREVRDEKDAKSSLTYMTQVAWEVEKNYAAPDFERVKCVQKFRR
eukprot:TRINITY_DN9406_c0_g1_i1.p1 TRINITY_DN9406_c0_g1~~TRINITY_DN9406_c0_g1_i1.p1  ORF type:complete len:335 (+),score=49.03 TRINITY_DN9406_c0_g1_i1:274-1278(+)